MSIADAFPIDQAQSRNGSKLPEIISAAAFVAAPMEIPAELVEGLIHQGTQTMVAGSSKSFKTWALLDLGLSVSAGEPWWGRETRAGRVLYLNFEIDPPFFQKRIISLAEAKGLDASRIKGFEVWNLRGHAASIEQLSAEIIKRGKERNYALIIPDPLYKLMGNRNENDAGQIAEMLNEFDKIAVETRAAIVYAHHFAKGSAAGKEQIDRASGSGVFARYPDGIITITPHEDDKAFVVEATLRNFMQLTPFGIRWEHPLMIPDSGMDATKLKQRVGRKSIHSSDDLLSVFKKGMTTTAWLKAASEERGVSKTSFYKIRAKMAADGIAKCDDGKHWYVGDVVTSFVKTVSTSPEMQR